jgi:hypothetical protein
LTRASKRFAISAPTTADVARRLLIAALLMMAAVACDAAVPTPSPAPAAVPSIRLGDWTASNGHWTFNATLNARGSPTNVVFEWGLGPQASPVFDHPIPVGEELLGGADVSVVVDIPEGAAFCARFVATNDMGPATSDSYCSGLLRSVIVVPAPSASLDAPTSP